MPTAAADGISTKRKAAASVALLGTAGILAYQVLHWMHVEWIPLAFSGILAASAFGITRRSLVVQALSRGAAWTVLFPTALALGIQLASGRWYGTAMELAFAATSGAALWLAGPMLRTKEALAEFAPKAYRRVLLAGSTATVATAYVTGGIGLEMLASSSGGVARTIGGLAFGALTVSLLASALAVVRMRAWGVLLGSATGIVLLLSALLVGGGGGVMLALCAAPMLALHLLPILLARWGVGGTSAAVQTRIAEAEPAKVRIALDEALEDEEPTFKHAALRSH